MGFVFQQRSEAGSDVFAFESLAGQVVKRAKEVHQCLFVDMSQLLAVHNNPGLLQQRAFRPCHQLQFSEQTA